MGHDGSINEKWTEPWGGDRTAQKYPRKETKCWATDGGEEIEMDFYGMQFEQWNNSGLLPLKRKSQFSSCTATLILESSDFDKQ